MAKPNPTMKHAAKANPKLSAEQAAIEDFLNTIPPTVVNEGDPSTFVDNSITEVVETQDVDLEPVIESVEVAEGLDDLAGDAAQLTTASAMESYTRIFHQLCYLSGHPVASVESYPMTKGGRARLVKAIRSHADLIRGCVNLSFESYADKVDQAVTQSMSNYKQALGELNKVDENSISSDGNVVINHKAVWQLFHRDGKLMSLKDFHEEVDAITKLAQMVSNAKSVVSKWQLGTQSGGNVLEGNESFDLMNNTKVVIKDGRSVWTTEDAPKPDREWSAGDWFWVIVFNWAGIVYRMIKGGSGDEKTKKEQSLKAIRKVVSEMKRLAPIVQGIDKDIDDIIKMVDQAPEEELAAVKRAASPALELAAKTIEHVTKVTYGAMRMFKSAESASK
jgi:hypothetical protein